MLLTGLAFLVFAGGSGVISWILIPRARRRIRRLSASEQAASWDAFFLRCYRFMVGWMRVTGLISYRPVPLPDGFPYGRPYVLVANHPSLIDILVLKATVPGVTCLVKASLFEKPNLRNLLTYSHDFPGPEGDEQAIGHAAVLDTFVARLQAGHPVIVFPEGTRSPRYALRRFRRGAAEAAIRAGVPIVPLFLSVHPASLLKGEHWYDVPDRMIRIDVEFLPIVPTAGADAAALTLALKQTYDERLARDLQDHPEVGAPALPIGAASSHSG
jgi:1-acyl-sn-glycerol-3-phosphate acyltransferase